MHWDGWFTLILLALMIVGLARYSYAADVIFLGGVTILGLMGIITPKEALAGFSNPAMLTVAALFVVAGGLRETGALDGIGSKLLRMPKDGRPPLGRLLTPLAAMSAFLNNTTIVAMALPPVMDWCRKHRVAASKVLIPVSYASIIGGVCTLIGTSTNLVVHGLLIDAGMGGFGFFEISVIGVPVAIISLAYCVWIAPRLLPERQEFLERLGESRREYLVEMRVEKNCPYIGKSVQAAGLRHLPGLFLVEIDREGTMISPVGPDEKLRDGDRLVFAGVVGTIVDLQKIAGLTPIAGDPEDAPLLSNSGAHLCEAVVSASSPLAGQSIRDAKFRTVYDAAIIAVHRNGERLAGKIGNIRLRPGDTLLLRAAEGFVRAHRNNPDFYLVSEVGGGEPLRREKAGLAVGLLLVMIAGMAAPDVLDWMGLSEKLGERFSGQWLDGCRVLAAMAAAGAMVTLRCIPPSVARRNIQWDVLFVIAASFGVAKALEKTGAAQFLSDGLLRLAPEGNLLGAVAVLYLAVSLLTAVISNNAAAALAFPIAMRMGGELGIDPHLLAVVLAVAASTDFSTPIGYQTNMMVFGPGGYKFTDYLKVGVPLNLIWWVVTVLLVGIWMA